MSFLCLFIYLNTWTTFTKKLSFYSCKCFAFVYISDYYYELDLGGIYSIICTVFYIAVIIQRFKDSPEDVRAFVDRHFIPPGDELEPHVPADWKPM